MKEKELYKTATLHELIYELKKIKVIETSDNHKFLNLIQTCTIHGFHEILGIEKLKS